jgi:hypothetical protein
MEPALKHVFVGLAVAAVAALLLVGAGTVLLLSVVFGFWTSDADMLMIGAYSGWCFDIAPFVGGFAFLAGVLGSLSLRRARPPAP